MGFKRSTNLKQEKVAEDYSSDDFEPKHYESKKDGSKGKRNTRSSFR